MQSLQGGDDAMLRLDQLEALYYELQLQLYDIQAEVLRCEELLLTAQLQSLRRQMTGGRLFGSLHGTYLYCCHLISDIQILAAVKYISGVYRQVYECIL